jgi:hypothetical protein
MNLRVAPARFPLYNQTILHGIVHKKLIITIFNDPGKTKPKGFSLDKIPPGGTLYQANVSI